MASMPPLKMGGPPPGSSPQGLSMIQGQGPNSEPTPPGGGGGIARVVFAVEQALDQIASALPSAAGEIDSVKTHLREVLAKAISGGASFTSEAGPKGLSSPSIPEGM